MAEDLIEHYINQALFEADTKFAVDQLTILETKYRDLKALLSDVKGTSGIKDITAGVAAANPIVENLTKTIAQQTTVIKDNVKAQADLSDSSKKLAAEKAKLAELSTEEAKQLAEVKVQQQQQTKANKEAALDALGLTDAYKKLNKEYLDAAQSAKNLAAAQGITSKEAVDAASKAKLLADRLLAIDSSVGQFQRNVGNYTGAVKILEKGLAEATAKLNQMTQAERTNTQAGQQLTKEVELLYTLTSQQSQGFSSLTTELRSAERALRTMYEAGLQGSQAFKDLQLTVNNATREVREFGRQQTLLSSEAPALAGLTAAARGLGAAYAIGAGASALFAGGNEKVEKELQKLVAVMTLLQGLTELNRALQERSAIVTSLLGVKTTILNAALALKNFILTGSITATTANTAATEGAAIAEGELAVATTAASTAMVVLRTALIATGIGAIVVLLGVLVYAMSNLKEETNDATSSIEAFTKSLDDSYDALQRNIDVTKKILETTKLLNELRLGKDGAKKVNQEEDLNAALKKQHDIIKELNTEEGRRNELLKIKNNAEKTSADEAAVLTGSASPGKDLDEKLKSSEEHLTKLKKDLDDATHASTLLRLQQLVDNQEQQKTGAVHLQELITRLNNEFEIYKLHQERKLHILDKEISDEKVYYTEKLTALDNFIKLSDDLNKKEEEHDIAAKQRETARAIQHLREEAVGKSGAEAARINANIKILESNLQQELNLIRQKAADRSIQIAEDAAAKREKIVQDELKKEEEAFAEYLKTKELLETDPAGDAKIKKALEKRLQLEKQYTQKSLELQKELNNAKAGLATQGENLLFTIATAGYDNKNNILEKQKDDASKKAQADIEAVNASTRSEQDKAAAIIIINARLAAFKEAADRKEKENNLKKAKFEQAQQIFEIGIQTIKSIAAINLKAAELRAAAALNPLLLALIPVVLAQIPFALASGALSIAAVLAKPLPHFRHGKNNDYAGPAIVGDGGVSEYIQRPDGSIYKTPAQDTLTYLGKTDVVYPNLAAMMRSLAMPPIKSFSDNGADNSFEKMLDKQTKTLTPLLQQIANKRENHLSAKEGALVSIWKHGANSTKYIDENTNW